jgi:glycosyltransferase involved in cell wall biosynthesis
MMIKIVRNLQMMLDGSSQKQHANRRVRPLEDLTIIVPTINSARYIDVMMQFYKREICVPVTLFIDSKTTDNTWNIAESIAHKVVSAPNRHTRVGEIIEAMSGMCPTSWVLRLDDDELPSSGMMKFVHKAIQTDVADAYSFRRHQCAISREGTLLRHVDVDSAEHKQWRLYRRDRVRFRTEGHTPGFHTQGLRLIDAPPEAAMIHLDWAVHSYDERKQKVFRYDAHTPNHGSIFRSYYLYEEQPYYQTRFEPLYLMEFDETCREISRRFSALTIDCCHQKRAPLANAKVPAAACA